VAAEVEAAAAIKGVEAGALAAAVGRLYAARRLEARTRLAAILGAEHGEDLAAWRALLDARRGELPRQVAPLGWLPE
jgi:hypothetical protein